MLYSRSVNANMMGAPWLDMPSKITETELSALEENYENMLQTIRTDELGGVPPPKYNADKYRTQLLQNDKSNDRCRRPFEVYEGTVSAIRNADHSALDITFDANANANAGDVDASNLSSMDHLFHNVVFDEAQEALNRHQINLSAQRVRLQLDMTTSPSPSLSTNPRAMSHHRAHPPPPPPQQAQLPPSASSAVRDVQHEERQTNLSLPFLTPPPATATAVGAQPQQQQQHDDDVIPESISPQIFGNTMQQPMTARPHPNTGYSASSSFLSALPLQLDAQLPHVRMPPPPSGSGQAQVSTGPLSGGSEIFYTNMPESMTPSMVFTPSGSMHVAYPAARQSGSHDQSVAMQEHTTDEHSTTFEINHHEAQRQQQLRRASTYSRVNPMEPPRAPQRSRVRRGRRQLSADSASTTSMARDAATVVARQVGSTQQRPSLGSIQHDLGSDAMDASQT